MCLLSQEGEQHTCGKHPKCPVTKPGPRGLRSACPGMHAEGAGFSAACRVLGPCSPPGPCKVG